MKRSFLILLAAALFVLPQAAAGSALNPHNARKCLLCHKETPRFGIDTKETVTFRLGSWDDPALCALCHAPEENLHPLGVKTGSLGTRAPARLPLGTSAGFEGRIVCTTCHFIHAAETEHALLRGFPGSQQPGTFEHWQDFCRECHGRGLSKRSPHTGDEQACVFCHQTVPEDGMEVEMAPRATDLCNFCHGAMQDRHYAGANPFEGPFSCLNCHDPHLGPERPARLRAGYLDAVKESVTIDPHYRRSLCVACHGEGEGLPLRSTDAVALCNRCHGTGEIVGEIHPILPVPREITPPPEWPLQEGSLSCLTCHLAGHPEDRGSHKFLRGEAYEDRNDFCRNCHEPKVYGDRNPHLDINRGEGCEFCHAVRPVPGRDTIDTVKFIAAPNLLCLRCHDNAPHPAAVEHVMSLSSERAALIRERFPLYQGDKIICASCHNPHIEDVDTYKLRGGVSGMQICTICHKY